MVKDYMSKTEELVLELVKKYPLYSLNKLKQMLPDINRHTIQKVLEKNQLSRLEERLAFTGNKEKSKFAFFTSLKTQLKQLVFNKSLFNIKNIIKLVFV